MAHEGARALFFERGYRTCPKCRSVYTSEVARCGLDGTELVVSDLDILIGMMVDRYQIVERLGEGGMARVYRAVHQEIGRSAAIKILFGNMAANRRQAERFRREAQTIARLTHLNIVSVLDYGANDEGITFITMEYLEGRTLTAAIAEAPDGFGARRAAAITRQIALGLSAAHEQGVIHRDLKSSNIMLVDGNAETVKILDFGLARVTTEDEERSRLTRTGHTLGTPHYMPPEQIRGEEVTTQSDLYALGVILHEMLAGKLPFAGDITYILYAHASTPPPTLAPAGGLEHLARELMAKSANNRPASAAAVVAEIDRLGLISSPGSPSISVEFRRFDAHGNGIRQPGTLDSAAMLEVVRTPGLGVVAKFGITALVVVLVCLGLIVALRGTDMTEVVPITTAAEEEITVRTGGPEPHADPVVMPSTAAAQPRGEGAPAPPASPEVKPPLLPERPSKGGNGNRANVPLPRPLRGTPSDAKPIAHWDREVQRALSGRGLSLSDVAYASTTRDATQRWVQAKLAQDRNAAEDAAQQLLPAIESLVITHDLVRRKFGEVEAAFAAARHLDEGQRAALRSTFDVLRHEVEGSSAASPHRLADIFRELGDLKVLLLPPK